MKTILFSIIIPHKNSIELLKRLIDSIPIREDIQIIIVDDNSDMAKININNLPGINRKEVEYIFLNKDQSKGAGKARNIGLERAKGKWLIFADSDDFFITDILSQKMDEYASSPSDIIFFNINCLYSESLLPAPNADKQYKVFIEDANATTLCRYKLKVPWGKFIKREFVVNNKIYFDETKVANDIIFSIKTGIAANTVEVDKSSIYVWLVRNNSLTSRKDKESALLHFTAAVRYNKIISEYDYLKKYRKNLFIAVPNMYRASISLSRILYLVCNNTPQKYILSDFIKAFIMYLKK